MITPLKLWLIVSSVTMVAASLIIVIFRPVWGIDFTGGSLLEVRLPDRSASEVTGAFEQAGLPATVQTAGDTTFLVRTRALSPEEHTNALEAVQTSLGATVEELRFESIGPTIGAELRRKAWIGVGLSIVVMILYLAYEFRHTSGLISSWKYGVAATITLVHDVLVVTACFVIFGHLFGVPFDTLILTALLSLFGFSVNDTIVFFNRLKQEWLATRSGSLAHVMDRVARAVLMRSLNTALTIFLTLLILLLFGGVTLQWFVIALLIGTVVGTYSTLFVAPPFLHILARR